MDNVKIKVTQEPNGDWCAISSTGLQAWGDTEEQATERLQDLIEKEANID